MYFQEGEKAGEDKIQSDQPLSGGWGGWVHREGFLEA